MLSSILMNESTRAPHAPTSAPLNLAQAGVLAGHVQDAESAQMTIGVASTVRPCPDVALLAEATRRAYEHNDGLRVLVAEVDGEWRQWVDEDADPQLIVHDVSEQAHPREAADRLEALLTRSRLPLDGSTPLITSHLIVLGPQEARWLFVAHHVVGDGYSGMLTRARVAQWYGHLRNGTPAPAPLTHSVRESWAQSERHSGAVQQWSEALAVLPERLTLADRAGERAAGTHRVATLLDGETVAALATAARHRDWIHPMVAISAAYTARITGSEHVVLGFIVAGRHGAVDREVVTQLARIVPLVVQVDPAADLAALTAGCRSALAATRSYGPITAEELRSAVPAAWRLGRVHGPTLNIVPFDAEVELAGHDVRSRVFNRGPVDDLQIAIGPRDGGIELDAVANAGAYSADVVERHVRRVAELARQAAQHPDVPVLDLDPSLPEERELRAHYHATTGCRIVDGSGRDALLDQCGRVLGPDGEPTGEHAMLHADGSVEPLGRDEDIALVAGFPVYLERVRSVALQDPAVEAVEATLRGRRLTLRVTAADRLAPPSLEALVERVRAVLPGMVVIRPSLDDEMGPAGRSARDSGRSAAPADVATSSTGR